MFSTKFSQPEELVKTANNIKIKEYEIQILQFFSQFYKIFLQETNST